MLRRCHFRFAVSALLLLGAPLASVRGDGGPSLEDPRIRIRVLRGGKPLSASVQFVLLVPQGQGAPTEWRGPQHAEAPMRKALQERSLPDANGGSWGPALARGTAREDLGGVLFNSFRFGFPARVRLAVYFPDEDRLFITNEAATRHYITDLTADLSEDGGGTLVDSTRGSLAVVLGVLGENVSGMGIALLLTVVLELAVLAACVAIARQWGKIRRLALLCALGNLITLPVVWFLAIYGKVEFDMNRALVVFVCAELAAVCFEGLLYAKAGGVRFGPALLWSFLANVASFLVGCVLVGLTV
jgi:hypothetical protein